MSYVYNVVVKLSGRVVTVYENIVASGPLEAIAKAGYGRILIASTEVVAVRLYTIAPHKQEVRDDEPG